VNKCEALVERGKVKYWEKNLSHCFTTNLTRTGLKTNPGLQGDKPATNYMRKD